MIYWSLHIKIGASSSDSHKNIYTFEGSAYYIFTFPTMSRPLFNNIQWL